MKTPQRKYAFPIVLISLSVLLFIYLLNEDRLKYKFDSFKTKVAGSLIITDFNGDKTDEIIYMNHPENEILKDYIDYYINEV